MLEVENSNDAVKGKDREIDGAYGSGGDNFG
jgi:hypothetical protein